MMNLEKTRKYLTNKQKLLLHLRSKKKKKEKKIIEELVNGIVKGIVILI